MSVSLPTAEDWLNSPINSTVGTIWLGGHLRDSSYIPRRKMRILGRYALVLVLGGEVFYQDELGRQATLGKGQAIIVTPKLAHAYGGVDRQTWSQSYVVFDGPQFDLLQQSRSFRSHQPFWNVDAIDLWNERLKELLIQPALNQYGHSALQTLTGFAHHLVQMMALDLQPTVLKEHWLATSMDLLGHASDDGWRSPQSVATQVGLSYENFRKLFSQRLGMPPAKYQRQRKIDRACAAIYRGSANFKELADALDFCDVYHFSKVFRQVKGVPPSAYRRSVRGE